MTFFGFQTSEDRVVDMSRQGTNRKNGHTVEFMFFSIVRIVCKRVSIGSFVVYGACSTASDLHKGAPEKLLNKQGYRTLVYWFMPI